MCRLVIDVDVEGQELTTVGRSTSVAALATGAADVDGLSLGLEEVVGRGPTARARKWCSIRSRRVCTAGVLLGSERLASLRRSGGGDRDLSRPRRCGGTDLE